MKQQANREGVGLAVEPEAESNRRPGGARLGKELVSCVGAQAVLGLAAAAIAGLGWGTAAAMSALAGAGAYVVPNAFFALRLQVNVLRSGRANPATFLIGEGCKLFETVLLLWLIARGAQQWLVWPALLFGLVLALKGYVLLPIFRKLS